MEALPLPQTKQSRWHNSTRGLAKQPRCQSRPSRKRLHFLNSLQGPGCLAKSALSCLLWLASGYQKKRLASGWLLAGFLVGHPPAWKNLVLAWLAYLAETGWTSPLPGGGLVEALPLPQTKQVGLRSSPGVDRLGRPEKGCTSLTPCKAALRNQASASLVGHPPAWKNLVLTWLKLVWLDLPTAWGRPCGGTDPPTNEASRWHNSTRGLTKQPRRRSRLGRPEKGCNQASACLAGKISYLPG